MRSPNLSQVVDARCDTDVVETLEAHISKLNVIYIKQESEKHILKDQLEKQILILNGFDENLRKR